MKIYQVHTLHLLIPKRFTHSLDQFLWQAMSDCLTYCYSSLRGHWNFRSHPCFSVHHTSDPGWRHHNLTCSKDENTSFCCLLPQANPVELTLSRPTRRHTSGACEGAGSISCPPTRECLFPSRLCPCCLQSHRLLFWNVCLLFFLSWPDYAFLNTWVSPPSSAGSPPPAFHHRAAYKRT